MSDPSKPGSGPAGWQPDPSGRHQYRYWDGNAFTDNVSDGGATSVDPYTPAGPPAGVPPTQAIPTSPPTLPTPVATPGPAGPTFAPPAGGPPTAGPPPGGPAPKSGGSKAPLIIGAIVVVALIVAGFLLFKGDDGGGGGAGAGTFTIDVPKGGNATHKLALKDNELALITATPKDKKMDVIVGIAVDVKSAGAKELDNLFTLSEKSSDLSDNGKLPATVVQSFNEGGAGKAEKGETPAPKAIDTTIVLGGAGGTAGKVELKIEVIPVKAKADTLDYLKEACKNAKFKAFEPGICELDLNFTDFSDSGSNFTESDFSDFTDSFSDFTDFSDPFSDFSDLTDFSSLFSDFSSFTDFFSS